MKIVRSRTFFFIAIFLPPPCEVVFSLNVISIIFLFQFLKSYEKMYKRNYHPLIILLYVSGMLDTKQLCELPKTTKFNWNRFGTKSIMGMIELKTISISLKI